MTPRRSRHQDHINPAIRDLSKMRTPAARVKPADLRLAAEQTSRMIKASGRTPWRGFKP